jgi:hypothetical protein
LRTVKLRRQQGDLQEKGGRKVSVSSRRWVLAFVGIQLIGVACMFLWQLLHGGAALIWAVALIALFPGNLLSAMLIEKLLWNSHLSSAAMLVAELPITVMINAALWLFVVRKLVARLKTR